MLEAELYFFFLAFSYRIPLQTSHVQALNGTTGAAMSLIRKSDVKNHLSTRTGASAIPSIHADATGYSEDGSDDVVVNAVLRPSAEGEVAVPAVEVGKPIA